MDFNKSVTKENLMRAFAGESQARNRYTFAAEQAKEQKLYVIEAVFQFTANQEQEHAEIFYNHLKDLAGENIHIDGSYPVDIYKTVLEVLKAAEHNEFEEYESVYRSFGDQALEEGFPKVAASFHQIAAIEKVHGERFAKLAELLEENRLFINDVECKWMCLNCGYVYEGNQVPEKCPVCQHEKGFFIRFELAPYTV